jgi:hypothetical protein
MTVVPQRRMQNRLDLNFGLCRERLIILAKGVS